MARLMTADEIAVFKRDGAVLLKGFISLAQVRPQHPSRPADATNRQVQLLHVHELLTLPGCHAFRLKSGSTNIGGSCKQTRTTPARGLENRNMISGNVSILNMQQIWAASSQVQVSDLAH